LIVGAEFGVGSNFIVNVPFDFLPPPTKKFKDSLFHCVMAKKYAKKTSTPL
jgi:hypothetical protein